MKRTSTLTTAVVVCCLLAGIAGAAIIDVPCDGADKTWRDDGSAIWGGQRVASVGMDSAFREMNHVLVFALPDLGGESIDSANLLMHAWNSIWGASLNLNLYGVRADASNATTATDLYVGPWDTTGDNGAPIMEGFAIKTAGNPAAVNERNVETDAAGDTALAAWLTSLYAEGYNAGDFVFLNVAPDTDYEAGSNSYVYFDTGDTTTVQSGASYVQVPVLSISTIPEPASLCLLALGGAAALRRKR